MGNVPVVHEVVTSVQTVGDLVTLNPDRAEERWRHYVEESVIGSGVCGVVEAVQGNGEKAKERFKGMGRATGQALLGGGLLADVPVFQEVATVGKSLGHIIGGGDTEAVEKEWDNYIEESMIGSTVAAVVEELDGNEEKAEKYRKAALKATKKAAVTATAVGATALTGGMAAPLGAGGAALVGGAVGAGAGIGGSAAVQAIDGKDIDAGEVIGAGILGGVGGAVNGYVKARSSAAARRVNARPTRSSGPTRPSGPSRISTRNIRRHPYSRVQNSVIVRDVDIDINCNCNITCC